MANGLAINSMGYNPLLNSYAANALLSEYGDTFSTYFPVNGMPYFGGGLNYGGGMSMGGMNGYGPEYVEMMIRMQEAQINGQVRMQQLQERAQSTLNSDNDVISQRIAALNRSVQNNDQNNVWTNYNALVSAVKEKAATLNGGVVTDSAKADAIARAKAQQLYTTACGVTLGEDIIANSNGTFAQGWKEAITFGLNSNNRTAEQNIAAINKAPLEQGHNIKRGLGRYLGGIGSYAAVGAGVGTLICPGAGTAIGASIGAIVGLFGAVVGGSKKG